MLFLRGEHTTGLNSLYSGIYMHAITVGEEEAMNVKKSWEGDGEGLEGGRRESAIRILRIKIPKTVNIKNIKTRF